jgi:ATP/maltotriose-dependent transcriptional regulator MalT
LLREAIDAFAGGGHKRLEGASRAAVAMVLCEQGAIEQARRESDAAMALLESSPLLIPLASSVAAEVERVSGNLEAALALSTRARDAALNGTEGDEALVALVHAKVLHAMGQTKDAISIVETELARIHARAAKMSDPFLRESFVSHGKRHADLRQLLTRMKS